MAAVATAHVHESAEGQRTCGTEHDEFEIQTAELIAADTVRRICAEPELQDVRICWTMEERLASPVVVPVWYHVVHAGARGLLTQDEVFAQFEQTQKDFRGEENPGSGAAVMDITFELAGTTYTDNAQWFSDGQRFERQIKNAVARDNTYNFNQYFTDFGAGLLGFCYFPNSFPESNNMHGCVNLWSSIPGGSSNGYNEGKTTTHETGHGIGLFHTFQGGCSNGDRVDDTCPQRRSTNGCPANPPSSCQANCPDPIHNYMDYSLDRCMYEFTPGQSERANQQLATFRPSLYLGKEAVEKIERVLPSAFSTARAFSRKTAERYEAKMLAREAQEL